MRRRTLAVVAAATSVATATVTAAAVARWARGAALGVGSRAPRPAGFSGPRLTVHAVSDGRVTLTRGPEALLPGTFGLTSATRHAVVGPVLDVRAEPDTVVRILRDVRRGDLVPGATLALTPQLYAGDPRTALGVDYTDVDIPAARGVLPAWFVPASRDTWVVALHGLGATREHPLNLLPFLRQLDLPVLLPCYRGDPGAPRPRAGVSTLGAEEWHDADAAVRYAVRYGARRVILYGWSVGGAMALYTAAHSGLRGRVCGLVLDSPVLDPGATARALAARRGVPGPLLPLAVRAVRADRVEPASAPANEPPTRLVRPDGTPLPVLLCHGPDDTVAPFEASRRLADRHPENVVLHTVDRAEHAATWNVDPHGYEETLRRFLTPLM